MIIRQLKFLKYVTTDAGREMELRYYLLLNVSEKQYGIAVQSLCDGKCEKMQYGAVTTDCVFAEELLKKLANGSVTPVTLTDILVDSL